MYKRYFSLLIALIMLFTSVQFVFAESTNESGTEIKISDFLLPYLTDEFSMYNAGSEPVQLYTISDKQFGCLVPLFENDALVGYAVMLKNSNNYELLSLEVSSEKAQIADKLMSLDSGSKVIYDFPFTFIISESKAKNYEINSASNEIEILTHEEFLNVSSDMPSSNLDTYIESKNNSVISLSAVQPTTNLRKWNTGDFVPVDGNYYGGYQEWLTTELSGDRKVAKFWSDRACGVAAAANVAAYLSYNMSGKSNLYNKGILTKYNFTNNMRDSSVPDLQNHWVTITKSYYFNNSNYIVTSNWGAKAVYNFDTWFDGGSLYQGIIYFK